MGWDWHAWWRVLLRSLAETTQPRPEKPPGPDEIVETIIIFARAGEIMQREGVSATGRRQARDMGRAARTLIARIRAIPEDEARPIWVWTQGDTPRHRNTAAEMARALGTIPYFFQDNGVSLVRLTAPFDPQMGPAAAREVNHLALRVLTDRPAGVVIVAEQPIISGIFAADPQSTAGRTIREASLHVLRVRFARNRVQGFEILPDTYP